MLATELVPFQMQILRWPLQISGICITCLKRQWNLLKQILKYAKLVEQTYKVPSCKMISGPLLDHYKNCMALKKETILKEADVFGLAWLSDGATVARMPLINELAMCANISPTTVSCPCIIAFLV